MKSRFEEWYEEEEYDPIHKGFAELVWNAAISAVLDDMEDELSIIDLRDIKRLSTLPGEI